MDNRTDNKSTVNPATDMQSRKSNQDFWNQETLSAVMQPPKDYDVSLGDVAKGVGAGAAGMIEGAGYLIDSLPGVDIGLGEGIKNLAGGAREYLTNSMSVDAQQAMSAPLTSGGTPTNAFSDIDVWAMKIAQGIGSFAGPMGAGTITKGITRGLMKKGVKSDVAQAVAIKTAERLGLAAGTTTAIAGDLGSLGNQLHEGTQQRDFTDLLQSPTFLKNLDAIDANPQYQGLTDAERMSMAREQTAYEAGTAAMTDPKAVAASVAGTLLGDMALMKPLLGRQTGTLGGARDGVKLAATKGFFKEGAAEAGQEGLQQYVTNQVNNEIHNDGVDLMDGVLDASIEGGLVGAATGGGMGAMGGASNNLERHRIDHRYENSLTRQEKAAYRQLPNDLRSLEAVRQEAIQMRNQPLLDLVNRKMHDFQFKDTTDIGRGDASIQHNFDDRYNNAKLHQRAKSESEDSRDARLYRYNYALQEGRDNIEKAKDFAEIYKQAQVDDYQANLQEGRDNISNAKLMEEMQRQDDEVNRDIDAKTQSALPDAHLDPRIAQAESERQAPGKAERYQQELSRGRDSVNNAKLMAEMQRQDDEVNRDIDSKTQSALPDAHLDRRIALAESERREPGKAERYQQELARGREFLALLRELERTSQSATFEGMEDIRVKMAAFQRRFAKSKNATQAPLPPLPPQLPKSQQAMTQSYLWQQVRDQQQQQQALVDKIHKNIEKSRQARQSNKAQFGRQNLIGKGKTPLSDLSSRLNTRKLRKRLSKTLRNQPLAVDKVLNSLRNNEKRLAAYQKSSEDNASRLQQKIDREIKNYTPKTHHQLSHADLADLSQFTATPIANAMMPMKDSPEQQKQALKAKIQKITHDKYRDLLETKPKPEAKADLEQWLSSLNNTSNNTPFDLVQFKQSMIRDALRDLPAEQQSAIEPEIRQIVEENYDDIGSELSLADRFMAEVEALLRESTPKASEPEPAPAPKAPEPAPAPKAPEPAPAPKAPEPAPAPKAPEPAPAPKASEPAPTPKAPEPAPAPKAPEPAPTPKAPEPAPTPKAPEPAPTPKAPEPEPTPKAPEPAPTPKAPEPQQQQSDSKNNLNDLDVRTAVWSGNVNHRERIEKSLKQNGVITLPDGGKAWIEKANNGDWTYKSQAADSDSVFTIAAPGRADRQAAIDKFWDKHGYELDDYIKQAKKAEDTPKVVNRQVFGTAQTFLFEDTRYQVKAGNPKEKSATIVEIDLNDEKMPFDLNADHPFTKKLFDAGIQLDGIDYSDWPEKYGVTLAEKPMPTTDFKSFGTVREVVEAWRNVRAGDRIKNHHGETIGTAVRPPRNAASLRIETADGEQQSFKFNVLTGHPNDVLLKSKPKKPKKQAEKPLDFDQLFSPDNLDSTLPWLTPTESIIAKLLRTEKPTELYGEKNIDETRGKERDVIKTFARLTEEYTEILSESDIAPVSEQEIIAAWPKLWNNRIFNMRRMRGAANDTENGIRSVILANRQNPTPPTPPKDENYGKNNKVFTESAATKAREILRKKLSGSQLNSGLDPEIVQAGIMLAGYHIEAGARKFNDYASAMIGELGDSVKPYLRSWYEGVRHYPDFDNSGMTPSAELDTKKLEIGNDNIGGTAPTDSTGFSGSNSVQHNGEVGVLQRDTEPGETDSTRRIEPDKAGDELRDGRESSVPGNHVKSDPLNLDDIADLAQGTTSVRVADNLSAIRTMKAILSENRPATLDEKKVMARYTGWGALGAVFDPATKAKFAKDANAELRQLVTDSEYNSIAGSISTAFYTEKSIVKAMWKGVEAFGLTGSVNIVEPSIGSGNFLGWQPTHLRENSKWSAAEIDTITGNLARLIYDDANIQVRGFEKTPFKDGVFSLAIGNPPFGSMPIHDSKRPDLSGMRIHNYILAKSAKLLHENGLMMMVVTHRFLDTPNENHKNLSADLEFIGAVRLPNTAFKANASTEVTTDIVVFRKLKAGETAKNLSWTNPKGDIDGIRINQYFAENPQNILGRLASDGKLYGGRGEGELTVHPTEEHANLGDSIANALTAMAQNQDLALTAEQQDALAADTVQSESTLNVGEMMVDANGQVLIRDDDDSNGAVISRVTPNSVWTENGQNIFNLMRHINNPRKLREAFRERYLAVTKEGEPEKLRSDSNTAAFQALWKYANGKMSKTEASAIASKYMKTTEIGEVGLAKLTEILALRKTLQQLLLAERVDAANVDALRARLNDQYDAFVNNKQYKDKGKDKTPNQATSIEKNLGLLRGDVQIETGLEKINSDGTVEKMPIFHQRMLEKYVAPNHAANVDDAVIYSIQQSGTVDPDLVADLLGLDRQSAMEKLTDGETPYLLFDPAQERHVFIDEYLSGNVKEKLTQAREENLPKNVKLLEKVQPEDRPVEKVKPSIRSAWMDSSIFSEYLTALGVKNAEVSISKTIGRIQTLAAGITPTELGQKFNGTRKNIVDIFTAAANGKTITIYDTIGDQTVKNDQETTLVNELINKMGETFETWAKNNPAIHAQIAQNFNERVNTHVERKFNGNLYLQQVGNNPGIPLRKTQKDGALRMIQSKNTLLDHTVGAGKTFTAITGIMERRRLGLSKKPLVVVPNHIVRQWQKEFYELYPSAKLLVADERSLSARQRKRFFAKIASGDFDAVIIGHSHLEFLPNSEESAVNIINEKIEEYRAAKHELRENNRSQGGRGASVSQIENAIRTLEEKMNKVKEDAQKRADTIGIDFDNLGIDYLVIDEAHEYKNLMYSTAAERVVGMNAPAGSNKAFDLLIKARSVQSLENGGVAFLTGTPISNSLVEIYTMMYYLGIEDLKSNAISHFDAFAGAFLQTASAMEYTATGTVKERRILKGVNAARELMRKYKQFADVITQADMVEIHRQDTIEKNKTRAADKQLDTRFPIPKVKGGKRQMNLAAATPSQIEYNDYLIARMNGISGHAGDKEYARLDNPLWVMSDAKKASLDIRLVDPHAERDPTGKIARAADSIKATYDQWDADKGTILVFSDLGTPSNFAAAQTKKDLQSLARLIMPQAKAKAFIQESFLKYADNAPNENTFVDLLEMIEREGPLSSKADAAFNELSGDLRSSVVTADTGFSMYDDLKAALIEKGIPAQEIQFIHDFNSADKKQALFADVKSGTVRVLMGSTKKMGAGTNVQDRIVQLVHLDCPWKPSDIEQREGRAIRQGNQLYLRDPDNFEVKIDVMITQGSSDPVMWQIQERKADGIEGFRNGALDDVEVVSGDADSFAEFKAASTGNPIYRLELQAQKAANAAESEYVAAASSRRSAINTIETYDRKKAEFESMINLVFQTDYNVETFRDAVMRDAEKNRAEKQQFESDRKSYEAAMDAYNQLDKKARKGITRPKAPTAPKVRDWTDIQHPYAAMIRDKIDALQLAMDRMTDAKRSGSLNVADIEIGGGIVINITARSRGDGIFDGEVAFLDKNGHEITFAPFQSKTAHSILRRANLSIAADAADLNVERGRAQLSALNERYDEATKSDDTKLREADFQQKLAKAQWQWLSTESKLADMIEDIRRSKIDNKFIDAEIARTDSKRRDIKKSDFNVQNAIVSPLSYDGESYQPIGLKSPYPNRPNTFIVPAMDSNNAPVHLDVLIERENGSDVEQQTVINVTPAPEGAHTGDYPAILKIVTEAKAQASENENSPMMYRRTKPATGMASSQVQNIANDFASSINGASNVNIVVMQSTNEMQKISEPLHQGVSELTPAMYHNGAVYLFADNFDNASEVRTALRHEIVGHHGLYALLGNNQAEKTLNDIRNSLLDLSATPDVAAAWEKVVSNYDLDSLSDTQKMDELFAHFVQAIDPSTFKGKAKLLWGALVGRTMRALRNAGLLKHDRISNAEMLLLANNILTHFKQGNGARGTNSAQMFMRRQLSANKLTGREILNVLKNGKYRAWKMSERGLMATLTIRQLAQSFGDVFGGGTTVKAYQRALNRMEAARIEQVKIAEPINELWDKVSRDEAEKLSETMNEATRLQVFADRPLADQQRYQDIEKSVIRSNAIVMKMSQDPNKYGQEKMDRARFLQKKHLAEQSAMEAAHKTLSAQYANLSDAAKAVYKGELDYFEQAWRDLENAMYASLNKAEFVSDDAKTKQMTAIKRKFNSMLRYGPYFPLRRFGEYVYVGLDNNGDYVREHFASPVERDEAMRKAADNGYDVRPLVLSEATLSDLDPNSMGYELMKQLKEAEQKGVTDVQIGTVIDAINQSILRMMPAHSASTRSIHRKGIKGASTDGRRAFADTAYHFALNYGKVLHGVEMENELTRMRKTIDASKKPGGTQSIAAEDLDSAIRLYDELVKRHKETMNPTGSPLASKLTSAGFVMYLGGSVGAGLINATQTWTVALPQLAAKFGWKESASALATAFKDIAQSEFKASSREAWLTLTRNSKLPADEQDLLRELFSAGVLDTTQSHALAMMSDTDSKSVGKASVATETFLRYSSSIFHNVEVSNREATALAAYRLMKKQQPNLQLTHQTVNNVADAVYAGHFDYASSNRPWFMRSSNFMRVFTQFKLYSQHMSYLIVTGAKAAIEDLTKAASGKVRDDKQRQIAKEFYGVMGMHLGAAGVLGLPLVSSVLMALTAAFDDEDDPWNAEVALKNGLASVVGNSTANLLLKGVGQPIGLDLHSRISLGSLWYREPMVELEGRDYGYYVMSQLAGPMIGGTMINAFQGLHEMSEGDFAKGASRIVPKFVRDFGKAADQAMNGLTDYNGNEIIAADQLSYWNIGWQALGITPAKISRGYDARSDIKAYRTAINRRRSALLNDLARAIERGHDLDDVIAAIGAFNEINPQKAITQKNIQQSLKARLRNRARNDLGVSLSDRDSYMREQAAWAN